MQEASARFVHALAAAVLGDGDPALRAQDAREALDAVFSGQKSLVLDVQFTGFAHKGQLVGGVSPALLRAAGHLITLRVSRVGFTPDAGAESLESVFSALSRTSGELAEGGAVGALAAARPRGVYLSTSTGQVYRPASARTETAASGDSGDQPSAVAVADSADGQASALVDADTSPAPAAQSPADADAAERGSAWLGDEVQTTAFDEFEIIESFGLPHGGARSGEGETVAAAPAAGPPNSDMFHFFRAADMGTEHADHLPALLRETDNVSRFDELSDASARTALALLRADAYPQAIVVLDALVAEAQRADRTRLFRDSAVQALRRVGTAEMLQRLLDRVSRGGGEREAILRFFAFLGGDALVMLEGLLHRTSDLAVRTDLFRTLLAAEGVADRLIAHAVQDPNPLRARALLDLATQPGADPEVARRYAAEAAQHRDAAVRIEAARTAAALGGRGALRVLVDLLGDADRGVKREAVQGLGTLGEAAAVPFLARLLGDGDEEVQTLAAQSLGRTGSADALPSLLALATRRSLLPLRKASKPRLAALGAIARIGTPTARDALASVAAGRDDLAGEARRLLAAS